MASSTQPSSIMTQGTGSLQIGMTSQFKGMRFCRECDNMLYPKEHMYDEHAGTSRLIYDCRQCGYHEKARDGDEWDNCVYKSDFNQGDATHISSIFKIDKDIVKDPTL